MKQQLTIVKVGGAVVEDQAQLTSLLHDFTAIRGHKLLVHGGGRKATKIAAALGIQTQMVAGRRITDKDMLQVVTMVYGGLINKNIVAQLQTQGVNALGMTGADMNILLSRRRPPVSLSSLIEGQGEAMIDYGFVGDPVRVDGARLSNIITGGITPIFAPLTHDGKGSLLNTNADTIAAELAKALAAHFDVTLIYAFEKPGVLSNPDDDNTLIPLITPQTYRQLVAEGVISGGMLPKIQNAISALQAGVQKIVITQATAIDGQHGTVITDNHEP
jgi:acetylglutamate kinase